LTLAVNLDTDFDYSIDWNTGLSSNPLPVNESGTYQANIQIAECTFQTNVVTVIFNECKNCEYYVPNSFSPNDDGFNDIYQIFFDESNCIISDFKMQVYNRWGGLIHESEQNQWNGRLNGEFLNNGVYLVCMEFTMEQEGQIVDKRECVAVNLLR
jgi:gliding motility-associated-like protein